MNKSNFLISCLLVFFFISCDSKMVYDTFVPIPNNSWDNSHKVTFNFDIKDTLSLTNLFIQIRNNKNYPYSNLFLITQLTFPTGKIIVDTLEYEMANAKGKFLGNGITDIKESKLYYKEHVIFPKKGNYQFSITQAMRNNGEINGIQSLTGITDVGLRIEKEN